MTMAARLRRLEEAVGDPEMVGQMDRLRALLEAHALSVLTAHSDEGPVSATVLAQAIGETVQMSTYAVLGMQARLLSFLLDPEEDADGDDPGRE